MHEIVLAWQLPDGTRCVLAGAGLDDYDLCLLIHNTVLRRLRFCDIFEALDVARQWRRGFEDDDLVPGRIAPVTNIETRRQGSSRIR
jgi:hypothetical protein